MTTNVNFPLVKYQLFLSDFKWNMKFLERFSTNTKTKFHENPFNASVVVPSSRTSLANLPLRNKHILPYVYHLYNEGI